MSGIEFGSIVEELVLIEFWWLSCIGSDLEFDVVLPLLVSFGLLCLDPLHVGSADLLITSLFGGWGLTNGCESVSGNSGWILQTDIVAVNINTSSASWVFGDEGLVVVHGDANVFFDVVVDITADTNIVPWNWSAEVSSSLLMSLLVCGGDKLVVVHDIVPEGKFHSADKVQNSIEIFFSKPISDVG